MRAVIMPMTRMIRPAYDPSFGGELASFQDSLISQGRQWQWRQPNEHRCAAVESPHAFAVGSL
jgi:hypothetical protein